MATSTRKQYQHLEPRPGSNDRQLVLEQPFKLSVQGFSTPGYEPSPYSGLERTPSTTETRK